MKTLLPLLLLCTSAHAETAASPQVFTHDPAACPDLTGTYEATVEGERFVSRLESGRDEHGPYLKASSGARSVTSTLDGAARAFPGYEITYACQDGAVQVSSRASSDRKVFANTVYSLDGTGNLVRSSWLAPWLGGGEVIRTVFARMQ